MAAVIRFDQEAPQIGQVQPDQPRILWQIRYVIRNEWVIERLQVSADSDTSTGQHKHQGHQLPQAWMDEKSHFLGIVVFGKQLTLKNMPIAHQENGG
jgi:hypothetical protein